MITLRLEVVAHDAFDLALEAPRFVLWRHGTDVRMSVDETHVARVRSALALRGVRASIVPGDVPAPPRLVRAVGTALLPARLEPEDLDIVDVRRIPLGEATERALHRPVRYWPLGTRRRSRCRALLRGTDALLEIRRTAWCARWTLRLNRTTLRPALFDREARPRPLRIYASERALTRWIEG
jgi:hypothetical protein